MDKKENKKKVSKKQRAIINSKKYINNLPDNVKEELIKDLTNLLPQYEVEIKKRGPGQPPVITQNELQVFKVCIAGGMQINKALYIAGIKKSTYYDYLKNNPEFSEEIAYIRESIDDQAVLNMGFAVKAEKTLVDRHMKENKDGPIQIPNTKYWLSARHKDFKAKLDVTHSFSLVDLHKGEEVENEEE